MRNGSWSTALFRGASMTMRVASSTTQRMHGGGRGLSPAGLRAHLSPSPGTRWRGERGAGLNRNDYHIKG